MWLRKIVWALCCSSWACTSADNVNDSFANLMALDDASRTSACLALPSEKKAALFFETQQRHHDYFGFDQCFASSPVNFMAELRNEIDRKGSVNNLTHYILVLSLSRQQGRISNAEIKAMNLPELCRKLSKGSPSHCGEIVENAIAE